MPYARKRGCKCEEKCKCGATWSITVDLPRDPATNKRKQKELSGFKTKRDAERAAAVLIAEIENGTYVDEKDTLFTEFADTWLGIYQATVKPPSVRIRRQEINILKDYFSQHKLKDITRKMYQDMLIELKNKELKNKKGYADTTISGVHSTGRMIFSKAVEFDIIKTNPTLHAKLPRTQKTVEQLEQEGEAVKYLEKEQLGTFLKTAKNKGENQDYIIFLLLAYSGMRIGELCALKWSDLNEDEHTISITKTIYNPSNRTTEYQLLPPKTKTSKRKIDIDPLVFEELKKHRKWQKEIIMEYRKTYHGLSEEDKLNENGFVIIKTEPLTAGYPEFPKNIAVRMHRLLNLAGLSEKLTPHSLRHTHCSLLAEAGVGLTEIMERLGHKDDQTTRGVYMHVTKAMKKEASEKFGMLMRSL